MQSFTDAVWFGLAVELAVSVGSENGQFGKSGPLVSHILAGAFFLGFRWFLSGVVHKMPHRSG